MVHVYVADVLPDEALAQIGRLVATHGKLTYRPATTTADLDNGIEATVLVVRSTRVSQAAIECAPRLELIVRAGSGTDTIATDVAAAKNIEVRNVPGRNAAAVAELAIGLLIALDRRIVEQVVDIRAGRWNKAEYQHARGIAGRSVGVVGLGEIGLAFAERAAAFGCTLVGVGREGRSPAITRRLEKLDVQWVVDVKALAQRCDVVSFHVPLTAHTRGMIGSPFLDWLAEGTIVLNTSRGELIDEVALLHALETKALRVGLDVYPDEPQPTAGAFLSALARHPQVIGTHHVGASTTQAQHAVADGVVEHIAAFCRERAVAFATDS